MSDFSEKSNLIHAQNQRIVICGTARNVSRYIERSVRHLSQAFSDFREMKIIICESFSTDNTSDLLEKLSRIHPELSHFSDSSISEVENRRTVRIASARNELLRHVKENYSDFDLVAMVDLDGVNRDLTRKQVLTIFNFEQWDGVFANQPFRYYDIWALRAQGWNEHDCWQEFRKLSSSLPFDVAKRLAITNKMISIPKNNGPILVASAFGGLGIYKMGAFLSGRYIGEDGSGSEICEHVSFHEIMTQKGHKLYILPSLVNLSEVSQRIGIVKEMILRWAGRIK
jgi:glycosyltransferase involved in cell wall biosynthesis